MAGFPALFKPCLKYFFILAFGLQKHFVRFLQMLPLAFKLLTVPYVHFFISQPELDLLNIRRTAFIYENNTLRP